MKRLLILHGASRVSRATTLGHLRAFARHPEIEAHYHHLSAPVTADLRRAEFDAIIVNYCFLMQRQASYQALLLQGYDWVAKSPAVKIALPMDDGYRSGFIEDWCRFLGVSVLFTSLYEHRAKLYPRLLETVELRPALTGYVDLDLMERVAPYRRDHAARPIDVGTRVARSPHAHGRYAALKADYAESFARRVEPLGLVCDVSTRPEDALMGLAWFDFLGRCRATVGMKGGYGLIDPRGDLRRKSTEYLRERPDASYDEVAAACFSGSDHLAEYSCISPRVFECAMMRTAQIMPPSNYLECMAPWKHYIPLSTDFSDLDQAVEAVRDKALCETVARNAFELLIGTGWFTHRSLVDDVLRHVPEPGRRRAAIQLGDHGRAVEAVKAARAALHPVARIALGHIFLYSVLHGAQPQVGALLELWRRERRFLVSADLAGVALGKATPAWFTASYMGQLNIAIGLGLGEVFASELPKAAVAGYSPLTYWPWDFSGSTPEIGSPSSTPVGLDELVDRGRYGEVEAALAAAPGTEHHHRDQALLALFRWARGDYPGARAVALSALEHPAPQGDLPAARALDGLYAAVLIMAERMGDHEALGILESRRTRIGDATLAEAASGVFAAAKASQPVQSNAVSAV